MQKVTLMAAWRVPPELVETKANLMPVPANVVSVSGSAKRPGVGMHVGLEGLFEEQTHGRRKK